jgi:uncharacterized protein
VTKHEPFESDSRKAKLNLRKHDVSFDDAAQTLADPFFEMFHVEEFDAEATEEAGEERCVTTGSFPENRRAIHRIVWTPRVDAECIVTRLISARLATAQKRKLYEEEIRKRLKSAN